MNDAELVARAIRGDQAAFGELVVRYQAPVRRVTRALLRRVEDADDAAQDAFLAAWRGLDGFDPSRPFGPWLTRIAVNAAHDFRRRRRVRETEPLPPDQPGSGADRPDRSTDRALLRARLDVAMSRLPERQRLVVVLFDVEGYSHGEIAQMLGVAAGTIRSDLFHARRALREALGPLEGEST